MVDDASRLTPEEVVKIREILRQKEFNEEAQARLYVGMSSVSKFVIELSKVVGVLVIVVSLIKGWAGDFIIGIVNAKK